MDNKTKNRHIMKKFRIKSSRDNMPYAVSKRFTRVNLGEIYKDFGYKVGAEIGVSKGKHAKIMCTKHPDMLLYGVDPYITYFARRDQKRQNEIHKAACKSLADYNFKMIRKTSLEAVKGFEDDSLDFVYIDGDHQFDYVMTDLIFWAQKVKSGGIVALHDYCHFHWSGVVKAVEAYVYCHDIRPWFITKEEKPTVFWVKK